MFVKMVVVIGDGRDGGSGGLVMVAVVMSVRVVLGDGCGRRKLWLVIIGQRWVVVTKSGGDGGKGAGDLFCCCR